MAEDIQLIEGSSGYTVPIKVNKENGTPDDLTAYSTVRLVITPFDYSSNVYNRDQSNAEVDNSEFADGIVNWKPSVTFPVPAAGWYFLQISRVNSGPDALNPARTLFLHVTRSVPLV